MKKKIFNILKSTDKCISGEKSPKSSGGIIQTGTDNVCRFTPESDLLSEDEIKARLKTEFIGQRLVIFDETDSTNLRAKQSSALPNGTVFIADAQTAGRGRLGRSWSSPKGTGIWLSILLKPQIPVLRIPQLTLAAGLAVRRVLGENAKIKWPNDIVMGTKKICGILTEMSAENDGINYVVCGMGINVNGKDFPGELREKATSLSAETGNTYIRNEIIADLLNEFEAVYRIFAAEGLAPLLEEYRSSCITLGREVKVTGKNNIICGIAEDISADGSLIISSNGKRTSISSGEAVVRGMYGYI